MSQARHVHPPPPCRALFELGKKGVPPCTSRSSHSFLFSHLEKLPKIISFFFGFFFVNKFAFFF